MKIILILCLFLTNFSAFAKDRTQAIDHHVQTLLSQVDSSLDLGIIVKDLAANTVWYQRNANRAYVPASTVKLFTAVAALKLLGPEYQFHTQLRSLQKIEKGVLKSPLYLRFEGDPRLTKAELRTLIKKLKAQGIQRIQSKIYIDDTALSTPDYGPGWMWDDSAFCFSGPIGAITIDGNCFHVSVTPNQTLKAPLSITKPQSFIQLFNHTHTYSENNKDCYLEVHANANNNYTVRGCMTQQETPKQWDLAITNPRTYAKEVIRSLFAEQHIKIPRPVYFSKTPSDLPIMAEHASEPLHALVHTMLKESDNLIAGILFKSVGAHYFNTTGRWRNSAKAMKAVLLDQLKINSDRLVILDGTGLSRYNLVTPEALVALLEYANKQPFSALFKASLPIAAKDGTLKDRMHDPELKHSVQAKTGAMTHVSTLAGFIDQKEGNTLAFAIMMNHIPEALIDYQKLQDNLCRFLRLI